MEFLRRRLLLVPPCEMVGGGSLGVVGAWEVQIRRRRRRLRPSPKISPKKTRGKLVIKSGFFVPHERQTP